MLTSSSKQKLRLYPYQYIDKSDFLINDFSFKVDVKNTLCVYFLKIIYRLYKKVTHFTCYQMDMQGSHMVWAILLEQFLRREKKNILPHKSHGEFRKREYDQLI